MRSALYYKNAIESVTIGDIEYLASNSVLNHHANGLHYLCLKRTEHETVKIYYLPKAVNDNNGYLVNPHNHRYPFESTILSGALRHLRFKLSEKHGLKNNRYSYCWETKEIKKDGESKLVILSDDFCEKGDSYRVEPKEIHTLEILEPTIIGLTQYEDQLQKSCLYIPKFYSEKFKKSQSRVPSVKEYFELLMKIKSEINIK